MDSAAKKSFELQANVRQNAEEIKNAFNDLYNWQKDIKDKEKDMLSQPEHKLKEAMTVSREQLQQSSKIFL